MLLTIICGLSDEADTITNKQDVQIIIGTKNLDLVIEPTCKALISWGVAGAIHPFLNVGDIVIANSIYNPKTKKTIKTNARWSTSIYDRLSDNTRVFRGPIYSDGDVHGTTPKERARIYKDTVVYAVDDESYAVADFAYKKQIPFISIRAISDSADATIPEWALHLDGGLASVGTTFINLLKNPLQTGDIIKMAFNYKKSLKSLREVYKDVGPLFKT